MTSPGSKAATRGQRRGLYWQDWYAAWTLLRCWAEPAAGITAVEVEAAGAPHIDDIVVYRRDRLVFQQLKHTVETTGRFTGADLFSEPQNGVSLIRKLYKGWTAVRSRASVVEVHLITNALASASPTNLLISPVGFEREILSPARAGAWAPSMTLRPIVRAIQDLTQATHEATLLDFFAALRLEFGMPEENEIRLRVIELLRDRLRPIAGAETEADAWVAKVYDLSTRHAEIGPLSRSEIDRELRSLFMLPHRLVEHRLALPEHHIPRPAVATTIVTKAHDLGSGYLRVLGPPGCGKTTLATWLANENDDELLMRYHVFDPQQASGLERKGRASALEFVRTMFDVLADRFPGEAVPHVPTEETLLHAAAALREELTHLAGGQLRLLILDGIDHVVRSRVDRQSLFDALPQPPPPNVVFILFGQPDWNYPPWLARTPVVEIPAFDPAETRAHVCARLGWHLDDPGAAAVADTLQERSKGNPLSLFYNLAITEKLGDNPDDVSAALSSAALFGGIPHQEYERLLDDVENLLPVPDDSRSLRQDLLACLTVAGVAITKERLCAAFSDSALTPRQARDFLEGLRPVVVEREAGRYWLFHDDFRRFSEERTNSSERTAAHQRLARGLEGGWEGEELKAWAEHLWLGGEYQYLADLPSTRLLEFWFRAAPKRAVVAMHRLSLASALRLGNETTILANALAAARAAEAADLPWSDTEDLPELGLKGWTFVVPPRGVDQGAMHRRASALRVAADGCERDPALATEVATRFLLPEELIPEGDGPDIDSYLGALAKWLLRSGDLGGARRLAETGRFAHAAIGAFTKEIVAEVDAAVLREWTSALAGVDEWLDRGLAGAALLHLADGKQHGAMGIARGLNWSGAVSAEAARDAGVLLTLTEGENLIRDEMLDAYVRWDELKSTAPAEWREFFFHGFVVTASGSVRELGLCEFPVRFAEGFSSNRQHNPNPRLAAFLWRCGCAAGLASRGRDLLTPQELERLLLVLIGEESLDLEYLERLTFSGFSRVYLPLIARSVRSRNALTDKVREIVVPAARRQVGVPTHQTYGLLEASWLVDPESWRSMAADAHQITELPGTEAFERAAWFAYWIARGSERGIKAPEAFIARSSVAALGVPRKTDPAHLAVELLCTSPDASFDKVEGIRCLIDLLIRLDTEPEGGRAAHRHLPRVLCLALQLDPDLFFEEFLRSTVDHSIAEPFGQAPANIAMQWLDSKEKATADELLALWYWVAACPGSAVRDGGAHAVGEAISQRLVDLGALQAELSIRRWVTAVAVPQGEHAVVVQNTNSQSETPVQIQTDADDSTTAQPVAVELRQDLEDVPPRLPIQDITGVTPRWFSPWWSHAENQILREFLATGGEEAWRLICQLVADQIAANSEFSGYDATLLGEGLADLRSCLRSEDAFQIALHHLAEKVRFQSEPQPRHSDVRTRRDRLAVFVALVSRGMHVSDAETLRRSLRCLGGLARNSGTWPAVEREMLSCLGSDEARTVTHALMVVRQAERLSQETREKILRTIDHPDAWCRWLGCSILAVEPTWPAPRLAIAAPGPISPEVRPSHSELGRAYYVDTSSAREVYLQKFAAILDIEEEQLRLWLEAEFRDLPPGPNRPSGWHGRLRGPQLTSHRMGEAAGRLACRLASIVPAPVLPALLSVVAKQDSWLLMAEPAVDPPRGWIEICRCESGPVGNREQYMLRSLGLVRKDLLSRQPKLLPEKVAEVATRLLAPGAPSEFAWVAEQWPAMAPPRMHSGAVVPLSFLNSPFTELSCDHFKLVPRWDFPQFRILQFAAREIPAWIHPELGPVLVAAYGEQTVSEAGAAHPEVVWWTGWYASPVWLDTFRHEELSFIHFWRLEWSARHRERSPKGHTIEHGITGEAIEWQDSAQSPTR